jgi:hypothetical protein
MRVLPAFLVALCGVSAGVLVGVVFGFSMASHTDVLRGVRPITTNRLILFLARPTREFGPFGGILFVALMLAWLAISFGLCALPAIAAQRLTGDGPPLVLVAYGFFAVATWLGWRFGAHAWGALT